MPGPKGIDRQIFALAWPAIVANITTPILGLVDTAIAGHLGSAAYLGAIALGSTVFNLLYWLFGFLRMATAGVTSQAFGAGDDEGIRIALFRSLMLAGMISIILIAASPWLGSPMLALLDADDASGAPALHYFNILIWGAPAMLATFALNGWMIGLQNTRLPMAIAIFTNIANITVSAILVFGFGLRIEGIAAGTLSSQWMAFSIYAILAYRRYRPKPMSLTRLWHGMKRLMRINSDIFLRTLCMVAVTAWFTRAGASRGVEVLAANAILMQLFLFFSYFSDGFAYAGEALAGRWYGADDRQALRTTVRRLLRIGLYLAAAFSVLYFLTGEWILQLLTDRDEVVAVACEYLPWAIIVPLCGITAFIFDGIAVGITATRRMLLSVAAGMVVYFALYFALMPSLGNHGLWIAFLAYLLVRGIVLARKY